MRPHSGGRRLLVESECSPYIQHVLCHLLEPPCQHSAVASSPLLVPPCRSVCSAVAAACKTKLGLSQQISNRQDFFGNKLLGNDVVVGLRDLLRCDLFPIDDGLDACTSQPCTSHFRAPFSSGFVDYTKDSGSYEEPFLLMQFYKRYTVPKHHQSITNLFFLFQNSLLLHS